MRSVSLRVSRGSGLLFCQLVVPTELKFGVGCGNAFNNATPLALKRLLGMRLPASGAPVDGSLIARARLKKVLVGFSSSLKSPWRMASDGTVPELVEYWCQRMNSSDQKKKSLLRPEL